MNLEMEQYCRHDSSPRHSLSLTELKIKNAFDAFFDKELKSIKDFYNFEVFTNWKKFARIGRVPEEVFDNFYPCSENEQPHFSHFGVAKNNLYLKIPFSTIDNVTLTICVSEKIKTKLHINVLESLNNDSCIANK